MKRTFQCLLVCGLLGAIYYIREQRHGEKRSLPSLLQIAQNDESTRSPVPKKEKKSTMIKKEMQAHPQWMAFGNYSLSTLDLVDKSPDLKELATLSRDIVQEIQSCLKDLCGIGPEADDPYFDQDHTQAHDFLERSLSILVSIKESGSSEFNVLSKTELKNLLSINNETIQPLALELLLEQGFTDQEFSSILSTIKLFHPDAIAAAFAMLQEASEQSDPQRSMYVAGIMELIGGKDGQVAVELARSSKQIRLSPEEFTEIAKASCFHRKEPFQHNWKMIKHHLEEGARMKDFNIAGEFCE